MKKIARLFLVLMLACALMTSTAIAAPIKLFSDGETIPSGKYDTCVILENSNVTINSLVEINSMETIDMHENATLTVDKQGILTGKDIIFSCSPTSKIVLIDGGKIELSFFFSSELTEFASLLEKNGITCHYEGNTLIAEKEYCEHSFGDNHICTKCGYECTHEEWIDGTCKVCGYVCAHDGVCCATCGKDFTIPTATGSTLSEGNLAIITAVAGLAVGFIAAMLVFKKKKLAVAGGAEEE